MSECQEVAEGLPLFPIDQPITTDQARGIVRAHLGDESTTVIDNVTQHYRARLNAELKRDVAHRHLDEATIAWCEENGIFDSLPRPDRLERVIEILDEIRFRRLGEIEAKLARISARLVRIEKRLDLDPAP